MFGAISTENKVGQGDRERETEGERERERERERDRETERDGGSEPGLNLESVAHTT